MGMAGQSLLWRAWRAVPTGTSLERREKREEADVVIQTTVAVLDMEAHAKT